MGTVPDQSIFEALRGYEVESLKHPTPRLVKIYISSTKQGELRLKIFAEEFSIEFALEIFTNRIQRRAQSVAGSHWTRTAIDLR